MRILLLASAYNGLCQRVHIELTERGHDVSIELALSDESIRHGIELFQPDIVICPFLKQKIPNDICSKYLCIIVHPGIKGDRGPSSLDWALLDHVDAWGVTAVQAVPEWDAGDIWATSIFNMREATKASIYRHEVTEAAIDIILQTIRRFERGDFSPEPLDYANPDVTGKWRPRMKQQDRTIDWQSDPLDVIIRKINTADSSPGVLDAIGGEEYHVYGAHKEGKLKGQPGEIMAQRHGAICRAGVDGAVWLTHLKKRNNGALKYFKLPAAMVMAETAKHIPLSPVDPSGSGLTETYKDIWYTERNDVGYLHFDFYNGAMSTEQCQRLRAVVLAARNRDTKVLVLESGPDFWSNGFHLNVIEAAEDSSQEAWRNINAIDDLVHALLTMGNKLTIAAMHGNAAAGGVPFALAADKVYARSGIVLNPHYKLMGLYGSEYWTYSIPKRVGREKALEITEGCLAMGTKEAQAIGLIDGVGANNVGDFHQQIIEVAEKMAHAPDYQKRLSLKQNNRQRDEQKKPLAAYRAEELRQMKINFYGLGEHFHAARYEFVHKVLPIEAPARIARHRASIVA